MRRYAGLIAASIELEPLRRLVEPHASHRDLRAEVTLSANRRAGEAAQQRDLADVRERVGDRALEEDLGGTRERRVGREERVEAGDRVEEPLHALVPRQRRMLLVDGLA